MAGARRASGHTCGLERCVASQVREKRGRAAGALAGTWSYTGAILSNRRWRAAASRPSVNASAGRRASFGWAPAPQQDAAIVASRMWEHVYRNHGMPTLPCHACRYATATGRPMQQPVPGMGLFDVVAGVTAALVGAGGDAVARAHVLTCAGRDNLRPAKLSVRAGDWCIAFEGSGRGYMTMARSPRRTSRCVAQPMGVWTVS